MTSLAFKDVIHLHIGVHTYACATVHTWRRENDFLVSAAALCALGLAVLVSVQVSLLPLPPISLQRYNAFHPLWLFMWVLNLGQAVQ